MRDYNNGVTPRARSYPKFCEVSPPKMRGVTPKNARRHPKKCEASPQHLRGVTPKMEGWPLTSFSPISRLCTFPPAHWWLILLINDFSLVIGGKLHSEYLGFSLLVANYSRNIPFFLPLWPGCRHIPYVH